MSSFRLRPRFQMKSPHTPEEIQAFIQEKLDEGEDPIVGSMIPGHIFLRIHQDQQHYWSPRLSLSLEKQAWGTLIRGLYGPAPNVWSLFLFAYAAVGILALFAALIGSSRLSLGMEAPILWAIPGLAGIALILYLIAQMGQKVGAEQTFTLHHFLHNLASTKKIST